MLLLLLLLLAATAAAIGHLNGPTNPQKVVGSLWKRIHERMSPTLEAIYAIINMVSW
jgi:hypothetical protein